MSKGRDRPGKEKKKPKSDKNKKPKHVPFGGKTPPNGHAAAEEVLTACAEQCGRRVPPRLVRSPP
jgi:hypothetical protein